MRDAGGRACRRPRRLSEVRPEESMSALACDQTESGSPSRYLTPAQVAELLQVSEKTVSRWALTDPSMPVLRRGRVVRFERERLLAWLSRQEPRGARRSARSAQGAPEAA